MNLSLKYLIREPKTKKDKHPIILLLHGYGSNEKDLFSFAQHLPEQYYIVSARAPYELDFGMYGWYSLNFVADQNKFSDDEEAKQSRDLIVTFINELFQKYHDMDKDNVTLVGFSQGSILSLAVALSYPNKTNKVVALSGYLHQNILKEDYEKNDFSGLKIFASHGTEDEVIPISWARKTPEILKPLGVHLTYNEYTAGHTILPENFIDFRNWIIENTP